MDLTKSRLYSDVRSQKVHKIQRIGSRALALELGGGMGAWEHAFSCQFPLATFASELADECTNGLGSDLDT